MRAAIVQDMNAAVGMPRHEDFEATHASPHEIAGFAKLTLVPDV